MSDPQAAPDDDAGIDAIGVDADFVTTDRDPEPDSVTPGEEQRADGDDDEVDVSDLP
ncbi:hypothetical protein J3D45_001629 [Microbacterium foliorum]|uniref:hypothetical protein n=1 Tax=Microbacterium foliorum TaxID=104336 RepID=UPI0020A120F6|nr:hypothetical protein [Microbacterium foliorum]MCP1429131.1 hypothetical protein [Microbacterium foliorum]